MFSIFTLQANWFNYIKKALEGSISLAQHILTWIKAQSLRTLKAKSLKFETLLEYAESVVAYMAVDIADDPDERMFNYADY